MKKKKRDLLLVILLLGILVLASYAYGISTFPADIKLLWGAIPDEIVSVYTISIIASAFAFFSFTAFVLFKVAIDKADSILPCGYRITFIFLYILILLPSALWLPLVKIYVQNKSFLLWVVVRMTLFLVGIGSLCLGIYIFKFKKYYKGLFYLLALIGVFYFTIHTLVLDAFLWPWYFKS